MSVDYGHGKQESDSDAVSALGPIMTISSFVELLLGITITCTTLALFVELLFDRTSINVSVDPDTVGPSLPDKHTKRPRRLIGSRRISQKPATPIGRPSVGNRQTQADKRERASSPR